MDGQRDGEKNIVSIEDRIPKLKQARKKKANRRMISYLCIFFCLISIIVYLQSPLSRVKNISINGNSFLSEQEILRQSTLTNDTNIWSVHPKDIAKKLEKNLIVKRATVKRKFPRTVQINVTEHQMVGYVSEKNRYIPILDNGSILKNRAKSTNNGSAPTLEGFTETGYLEEMTKQLQKLPNEIFDLISEIHWAPTKKDESKIKLYMNDGNIVLGRINNFSKNMQIYPSIVAQLDPKKKGIVHIGVGAYFEEFSNKDK
ncbi:FtsQ-type POTRA domain-containing protein [Virgibacillus sp. 179-BFC.A HS]|uniref:Cell division protein DivIB n=1 Tax=Tigheibacillus jepli TaxID=3035914 RepID=A0ABU5CI09_9BACI|nr:FtsQ-type POTRA domain-containing protein [Virgibacillus sp. 179-BFC.A HS]MDY0405960.1 FtsQ-type POTRA domain-containing protein [Virgibacillus sp. 179-BFC.A HS]